MECKSPKRKSQKQMKMHFEQLASIANDDDDDDQITKCDRRVGSAVLHIYLQIKSNLNEEKIHARTHSTTTTITTPHVIYQQHNDIRPTTFYNISESSDFFANSTRTHTKAYFDFFPFIFFLFLHFNALISSSEFSTIFFSASCIVLAAIVLTIMPFHTQVAHTHTANITSSPSLPTIFNIMKSYKPWK